MNASAADREIAALRAELEQEFQTWERLYREGAGDPCWPDGVYLNLCRAKIIRGVSANAGAENREGTVLYGQGLIPGFTGRAASAALCSV